MYKAELDNELLKNDFPNYFLLYGANSFLNDYYAQKIRDKYKSEEHIKLYFEEYDIKIAKDYLSSQSLFASSKFLEIRLAKKPLVKEQKELASLIKLCEKNKENAFLLVLYESQRQSALENTFFKNFARFFELNFNEACLFLEKYSKELEITLKEPSCLAYLLELFDANLGEAACELLKFQKQSLSKSLIKATCIADYNIDFEDIIATLFGQKSLNELFAKLNIDEFALLNMINLYFYKLFKLSTSAKLTGKLDCKSALGYAPPPAIQALLRKRANYIKISQYKDIFILLLECEYELKKLNPSYKTELLLSYLLKIQKILRL